jgi:hypothetical protein
VDDKALKLRLAGGDSHQLATRICLGVLGYCVHHRITCDRRETVVWKEVPALLKPSGPQKKDLLKLIVELLTELAKAPPAVVLLVGLILVVLGVWVSGLHSIGSVAPAGCSRSEGYEGHPPLRFGN